MRKTVPYVSRLLLSDIVASMPLSSMLATMFPIRSGLRMSWSCLGCESHLTSLRPSASSLSASSSSSYCSANTSTHPPTRPFFSQTKVIVHTILISSLSPSSHQLKDNSIATSSSCTAPLARPPYPYYRRAPISRRHSLEITSPSRSIGCIVGGRLFSWVESCAKQLSSPVPSSSP